MMKRTFLFFVAAIFLAPGIALAATAQNFQALANQIVTILNSGTGVLIVLGVVVYFYGAATSIVRGSEHDYSKLRNQLVWGMAILFLMVSIWGVVQLVQNTIFGSNATNSPQGGSSNTCSGFGC
jgi:hypothetical protein